MKLFFQDYELPQSPYKSLSFLKDLSFCLHQSYAVLCRNGISIPLSQENMPCYLDEKKREEELVRKSSLLKKQEVRQMVLSEDEEFMIIRCAGIWDVVSNQEAVGVATSYG
uniref:PPM-type phosphatase domain-containing protein n=1 Tax=Lactuca sativa TaxID=4236 RepID=A0A9R1XNX2_LACSA|nr:hypothetical protein LSAT_V11C400173000 [Lactuca sativa]